MRCVCWTVSGRFDVRRLMTHQVSIVSATHQRQRTHHLLLTMRFSAAAVTACTVASTCLLCDNVLGKIFGDGGVDFVVARHLRSALCTVSLTVLSLVPPLPLTTGFAPRAIVSRPSTQGVATLGRLHSPSCACPACVGLHLVSGCRERRSTTFQ